MIQDKKSIDTALEAFGEQSAMLVELTLKDADRLVNELETAVNSNNTEDTALAAHSLKSIMLQIGAYTVADIALNMETAGKNDDITPCKDQLSELQSAYSETKSYLDSL